MQKNARSKRNNGGDDKYTSGPLIQDPMLYDFQHGCAVQKPSPNTVDYDEETGKIIHYANDDERAKCHAKDYLSQKDRWKNYPNWDKLNGSMQV